MSAWMQLSNIRRSYGSIHALKGVDLNINHGEVIGLVGENGAGKSTLMKIMSGFDDGFEGEFLVDNVPVKLGTPQKAQEQGIQPAAFLGYLVAKDPKKYGSLAKLESIINGKS